MGFIPQVNNKTLSFVLILACMAMLPLQYTQASEARVAVASNFAQTAKVLAKEFERDTGKKITLIFGATGKHYAQIKHGAPFDVFLAADSLRPARLEKEKAAIPGSRFTYAIGKLVLWSPKQNYIAPKGDVLRGTSFNRLAMANPRLAPYGKAAQQVLEKRGLWKKLRSRIVRGENIGQTYQFVKSGNAELGFIAYAQVYLAGQTTKGSHWLVPQKLYTPIKQQAILLKDKPDARQFLSFLQSSTAINIIQNHGYDTP